MWKRQNRDAFSTLRRETFRASTRERTKERTKERTLSSSFSTREIVVLLLVVVVWCAILFSSSLSKQKDTQGTGTQFFPHFFFLRKTKTEREKIIWNGKRRREDSLFVSFLMFRYNSLFISLFVATTTTTTTTTTTRTTTTI